jgi:hypothetical protein
MKRITDVSRSEFQKMGVKELTESIRTAEGRTVAAEVFCDAPPLIDGITNAELGSAMGADIIILNHYDVEHPFMPGLPLDNSESELVNNAERHNWNTLASIKKLVGRPVGINLVPESEFAKIEHGRLATPDNAETAISQGADIIFVTGTPGTGVTNDMIANATKSIRDQIGNSVFLISGKPVGAGIIGESGSKLIDVDDIRAYRSAGCDAVALPMPGGSPGWTAEAVRDLVDISHEEGLLTWLVMVGSIEGAPTDVIHHIALEAKMTGADVHEIGEGGYSLSIAVPENIMEYSLALRGRRHTYRRMSMSILR